MNQQAMEQALGKLVMDGGFRDAFFSDPAVASETAGIALTDRERNALMHIRPGALAAFQRYLDAKGVAGCRRRQAQDVEGSDETCWPRSEP
jgi:hypothetical protein